MEKRWLLIAQIKKRGGLLGIIANQITDPDQADQFIIMCFEQCHNRAAVELWGKTLVLQIVNYRLNLVKQKFKDSLTKNTFPLYYPTTL